MYRKYLKLSMILVLVGMHVFLLFGEGYAAPTVKLIVNPNRTDVSVGADPIALTAKASGSGLTFAWKLQGPGKIEGAGSAIFYQAPETIEKKTAQAIVTVTVKDADAQETTEAFTFNILAPKRPTSSAPVKKGGMSTTTKVAIGVGALAVAGGVVAMAAGGDSGGGSDKNFSGTFQGETGSGTTSRGNTYTWSYLMNLNQSGNTISGSLVKESTLVDCCTTVITVPVTGSVDPNDANSGNLTWGYGEGDCECAAWTWTDYISANSGHVTLIGGNTIRFDAGAEYDRLKIVSPDARHDYATDGFPGGSFIRR